jgi:hypothetical protein
MEIHDCPLCTLSYPRPDASPRPNTGAATLKTVTEGCVIDVNCKRCGPFVIGSGTFFKDIGFDSGPNAVHWELSLASVPSFLLEKGIRPEDLKSANRLLRRYLSIYTRECMESGREPELLDRSDLGLVVGLAETYAAEPIASKPERLLRLVEKRTTFPGSPASMRPELDYPAVRAVEPEEVLYYLRSLVKENLVECSDPDLKAMEAGDRHATLNVTLTLSGSERLRRVGTGSRIAFVAMSFDPSLNSALSDGIAAAISDAKYEPLRVDKVHHNEKICDRIVVDIRRSRFVVADVTMQRQGVYFEAGFAMALGLPVIWCCRKDDLNHVHFDTRQYNHIVWEQPADLRQQLLDRILATIGTSP